MEIKFILRDETLVLEEKSIKVKAAMAKLNLSMQAYLPVRDGMLLNEGDTLRNGETIKLVAVISGG
jgi:sulfur carrier protein ThiS